MAAMHDPDGETIVTERLILGPHRAADLDGYAPLWVLPPEGRSFTSVLDREGAWARLLRLVGHRQVFGYAPFLVRDRASGEIIGEVGFARFERGLGADFDTAAEAMWILAPQARHGGIGTEAMTAAAAAFDARFPGARSVCMIDPINTVSLRLAARLGFTAYRGVMRRGMELDLFERIGRARVNS